MKVWRLLARYAGWRLAVSIPAGIAGGASLAALMRMIHRALTLPNAEGVGRAVQFLALIAAYFLGTVVAQYALSDGAERLKWQLRLKLLRQTLARPLQQSERIGQSRMFGILGTDIDVLAAYLFELPDAVVNGSIAVGCFGYMAWLSPFVFLFNLCFVGLAAACYLAPKSMASRVGHQASAANDRLTAQVHYAVRAVKTLLLSSPRRTDFVESHFTRAGAELRRLNLKSRLIQLFAERFAEAMILGNVACLLFALPRWTHLPMATATGVLLAAIFARQPLKDSLNLISRTQVAQIILVRMGEVGLDPFAADATTPAQTPRTPPAFRDLAFEDVRFHYGSDHGESGFKCGPFSLRIRAAEIVFIVGGNGGGKTTLAKLLSGLYPPVSGHVVLDGAPIATEAGRTELRERFAAVFQEDPLFEHILGLPSEEAERRGRQWLNDLRLEGKVGLDGARFTTTDLSQGQMRRLVLLGALAENRPILLLDEWAAEQDPLFREFFYRRLIPELRDRGRTVIVITHDDRYYGCADRVIKIENGRIAA